MGDFNYGKIHWENGTVEGPDDSEQAKFLEATYDALLYQHVTFPTRYREPCIPSRLDLVFTKEEGMIDEVIANDPLGKSDHLVLTWELQVRNLEKSEKEGSSCRRNFRKGDYASMRASLQSVDWQILDDEDVNEIWDSIRNIITEHIQRFVPKHKKKRVKRTAPWWSRELTKEVKMKHRIWKEYLHNKSEQYFKKYTAQRNKTTKKIREARRLYEHRLINNIKQEPKKLHQYIRDQQKVRPVIHSLEGSNGRTETDRETAEVLQTFFKSVFVEESDGPLPDFPEQIEDSLKIDDIDITRGDVKQGLENLDECKAAGPDEIPSIILKRCANELSAPLLHLFRKTLVTGSLPAEWKKATITPIFKKGLRHRPSNYRPVSLTSQVCKVMERIIRINIVSHLEMNELISKHQHGFTARRSCQSNLLEALEQWTAILDEGHGLDIVFLDYQKAFDSVPHRRLLKKLNNYGIKGKLLMWLKDFLSDRMQQVTVGNSCSEWGRVTSGVPQGSVLGPVLFLLYVNELPTLVRSHIKLFADDAKIYRALTSPQDAEILQADINALEKWSDEWLLKFNPQKCQVMHCGSANSNTKYVMKEGNGKERRLSVTSVEKDLGVYVTDNLKPTIHCQKASNKAMSALRRLKMTFDRLTIANFKILYITYIRPHLEHGIQAVGPYMSKDFKALEKVQRRATKMVSQIKHLSYEERLRKLKLPSIEKRILRGDLIETYKILTGKINLDPDQFFELNRQERTRGHSMKLLKRRSRQISRLKFFANRVVTPWNELPQDVVSADSINAFKNRLDDHWTT